MDEVPLIRLANASLTYGEHQPVVALQPTDLTIGAGEHVSVTGPSGSGKSTLLSVIGLLDPPSHGTVTVCGVDTSVITAARLGQVRSMTFGFVFQRFHLLPALTAIANVELALMYQGVPRPERETGARAALDRVGLGHRVSHRPSELSGGEQQRVAIARAIACDQPCLLADEPTGNLDSETTANILDLLDQIASEGTTVVCVTHSETVARRARRQLVLKDGSIVWDGPPR